MGERLDGTTAPRKDVYVYVASGKYLAANPVTQGPDVAQPAVPRGLRASGKDRNSFDSLDHLCRLALRDGFRVRDPDRKPHNLPFTPLGTLFKGRDAFLGDLRRRFSRPDGQARQSWHRRRCTGWEGSGRPARRSSTPGGSPTTTGAAVRVRPVRR